jgi:hypothetical protein
LVKARLEGRYLLIGDTGSGRRSAAIRRRGEKEKTGWWLGPWQLRVNVKPRTYIMKEIEDRVGIKARAAGSG